MCRSSQSGARFALSHAGMFATVSEDGLDVKPKTQLNLAIRQVNRIQEINIMSITPLLYYII